MAAVNMSDSKRECPSGFTTFTSPIRSCGCRDSTRITSTTFSVGHSYYRICGRVTAIQKGSTDGFGPTFNTADPAQYVDGVAISHGASISEGHIWTFAAAVSERIQNLKKYNSCPCAYREGVYPSLPSFIGSNYFCESGNPSTISHTKVFLSDPLWDGRGCAFNSTCCKLNNPPWFYVELTQSTTDDMTMSLLINSATDENIFIKDIELYVSP